MQIHSGQFEYMVSQTPPGLLGQFLIISLMTLLLMNSAFPVSILYVWNVCGVFLLAYRYLHYRRFYQDQNRKDSKQAQKWVRRYIADVLLMGILWAILFVQIIQLTPQEYHYIAMAVALGLAGAAIVTMGSVFPVYFAFVFPMLAALIVAFYFKGTYIYTIASLVTLLGLVYLLYTAHKYSRNFLVIFEKSEQLKETELEALECLGKAGEYRDTDTGAHVFRVGYAAYRLALSAGFSESDAKTLMLASPLHDVGKIGISDNILLKPGKLTDEEWLVMKEHARMGAEILKSANSNIMKMAKLVAISHHEKWDGSGYPNGLSGEDIPVEGRIVAICDVFDALVSSRPYKKAWSEAEALDFLRQSAGTHFDPKLVELFVTEVPLIKEFSAKLNAEVSVASHPLLQFA